MPPRRKDNCGKCPPCLFPARHQACKDPAVMARRAAQGAARRAAIAAPGRRPLAELPPPGQVPLHSRALSPKTPNVVVRRLRLARGVNRTLRPPARATNNKRHTHTHTGTDNNGGTTEDYS
eukprot:4208501-Pyramimonas_sp.AAC.1